MAEYIECRNCESPDCKGCNIKTLETMLKSGKFDCMMNANRCINPSSDVAPVRHGRWLDGMKCSKCGQVDCSKPNYYPHCGAKMDLDSIER